MVSHLRFPPGLAGGLLLAYPRTLVFSAVPFGQRDFFAFVHSCAQFVDAGKGNLRHGQPFAGSWGL